MPSINKISNETLQKLKNKSIKGMAVNPSEKGASAKQVRDAMVEPYIGDNLSLATEINRIVEEANQTLESGLVVDNEISYSDSVPNPSRHPTWIAPTDEDVEYVGGGDSDEEEQNIELTRYPLGIDNEYNPTEETPVGNDEPVLVTQVSRNLGYPVGFDRN